MGPKLSLTPPEALLRKCLLDCRDNMQHVKGMKDLELRWTGGWVRDKLLGSTSNDIDLALSTMTGEDFGLALQEYMQNNVQKYEDEARRSGVAGEIRSLHKIEANPEKSKHLATATTRVFDIDVDFVNLRKEIYDDKSRNPQVEFGTAEEDALRRDATVNAMFYNLDSQLVEDYTHRGLEDMSKKIIRTPLEPYQTFKDDPLRVLRLIRFAARLDYTIEAEALICMADPKIHEELRRKISRERILVEVTKIMTGPDPYGGLKQIYDLDLYKVVFSDPNSKDIIVDESMCAVALDSLRQILQDSTAICMGLRPKDDIALSWLLACYVPWYANDVAAMTTAREGLKVSTAHMKAIGDSVRNRENLTKLVASVAAGSATRSDVGMTLKQAGINWRPHVLYALLYETTSEPYREVIDKYSAFVQYLQDHNMEDAASMKPIINGNDIKKALGVPKAGNWIKQALEIVTAWQFENPSATAEDAKTMIATKRAELGID